METLLATCKWTERRSPNVISVGDKFKPYRRSIDKTFGNSFTVVQVHPELVAAWPLPSGVKCKVLKDSIYD